MMGPAISETSSTNERKKADESVQAERLALCPAHRGRRSARPAASAAIERFLTSLRCIQDFSRWNSYDETEDRHCCIQQRASLILKSQWRIWLVLRPGRSQRVEVGGECGEGAVEGGFIRRSGAFVFHRYPQVHCERFRCKGANLSDDVLDRLRSQAVRTKRSESAKVGDRCRQFL